jgi:hypothetical protein
MTRDVIRAGRRASSAPPVPALVIHPDTRHTMGSDPSVAFNAMAQELSPLLPVMCQPDGLMSVLCPLMTENQIAKVAEQMLAHFEDAGLERRFLTTKQLGDAAPLALYWEA